MELDVRAQVARSALTGVVWSAPERAQISAANRLSNYPAFQIHNTFTYCQVSKSKDSQSRSFSMSIQRTNVKVVVMSPTVQL